MACFIGAVCGLFKTHLAWLRRPSDHALARCNPVRPHDTATPATEEWIGSRSGTRRVGAAHELLTAESEKSLSRSRLTRRSHLAAHGRLGEVT